MPTPRIFISHSNHDNAWCRPFAQALRDAGFDVWYDETDMLSGQPFPTIIGNEIETREVFIIVFSPEAKDSYWVNQEINLALTARRHIIPIMLRQTEIGGFLRSYHYVNAEIVAMQEVKDAVIKDIEVKFGQMAATAIEMNMQSSITLGGLMRRFPLYLLLDCSASMVGAPIQAIIEGLELLCREFNSDIQASETAWISIIRFGGIAEHYALTPVNQFVPPTLTAQGQKVTGSALRLLAQSLLKDLIPKTATIKGDYRPLVFLLTDGQPADLRTFETYAAQIKGFKNVHRPTIVVIGVEDDFDKIFWSHLTDNVFSTKSTTPDGLRQFFKLKEVEDI